jgi:hypothetical protein
MLLGVLHCAVCGERLYYGSRAAGARYRHAGRCPGGSYTASHVEAMIENGLLAEVGDVELCETITVPGENHDAEIKGVRESIKSLDAAYEAGDVLASTYGRMQARLEARLEHLESLPSTPDRIVRQPTGQTFSQKWAELDRPGREHFLREAGVTATIERIGEEEPMTWPEIKTTLEAAGVRVEEPVAWTEIDSDPDSLHIAIISQAGRMMTVYLGEFGLLRDLAAAA